NHQPPPDPNDAAFLDELRRLEGMPPEVLNHAELMQIAMPALRADAAAYRRYIYKPGDPLSMPIHAYGGTTDANVGEAHLRPWGEQTTSDFSLDLFKGGHFYIQTAQATLLERLAARL